MITNKQEKLVVLINKVHSRMITNTLLGKRTKYLMYRHYALVMALDELVSVEGEVKDEEVISYSIPTWND